MASLVGTLLIFAIALIISTLIIYVIVKFFGESEGITTALIAALIGTIAYTIIYSWLGQDCSPLHSGNRMAAGITDALLNRLDQIPAHCCCHMGCGIHCRWILPTLTGPL